MSALALACVLAVLLIMTLCALALREMRNRDRAEAKNAAMRALEDALRAGEERLKELEAQKAALEKSAEEMRRNSEKQEKLLEDLRTALNVNSFDGRFPICSNCKDIRDEKGCWHTIEEFIANMSEADFSHSLCPDCARKLYPEMFEDGRKLHTLTWK